LALLPGPLWIWWCGQKCIQIPTAYHFTNTTFYSVEFFTSLVSPFHLPLSLMFAFLKAFALTSAPLSQVTWVEQETKSGEIDRTLRVLESLLPTHPLLR
jgi:hypothetical protein